MLMAVGLNGGALAQSVKGGTYYCVVEFSGGLSYDSSRSSWRGTSFRADGKFVLKVNVLSTKQVETLFDKTKTETVHELDVTITEGGSSTPHPCLPIYPDPSQRTVTAYGLSYIHCESTLTTYKINLENGRFISAYLQGYYNGQDNNKNTPGISGGTCTKI